MAESNLHGIMDEADSDLSGTMYEYSGNQTSGSDNASDIKYDNSSSGLTAENVQEAIDEIASSNSGANDATDYSLLANKPSINGVTLVGNLTSEDLNLGSSDGADGFSPIIDVIEIEGGHKVTITDANDTESFNVMDGKDGADAEVPEALPNPNALTLTGAVSAVYDGSEAVTVEIPSDGGSGSVTVDSEITESGANPVTSAAIFAALAAKSDKKIHLFKRSKQVLAEGCAAGYSTDVLWQSDNAVGGGANDEYFAYDDDTGFLTVRKAGKYLCVVQLRVAGTAEGYSSVFLDLNDAAFENTPGVPYYLSTASTYKYPSYPTHMSVVQLAAGDQLNARAKFTGKNGNTGVTYNLGDTAGFFTVMYLGE